MKVLLLNGSAKPNGNTAQALEAAAAVLRADGIETELFQLGGDPIRDCIGCGQCTEKGCHFDDDRVNEFIAKARTADGFIFGTPVYYAHPSGRILSFLDRVFYAGGSAFFHKPGASVAVARRGGCSATFDELNKYFTITNMPIASSQYWNSIHGRAPGEADQDEEGKQTMRTLARNMTFLMRSIALGKEAYGLPQPEPRVATHFIR